MMNLLVIFVALPLFAAFALPVMGRFLRRGFDAIAVSVTGVLLLCVAYIYIIPGTADLPLVYKIGSWNAPFGIS